MEGGEDGAQQQAHVQEAEKTILTLFHSHASQLEESRRLKKQRLKMRSIVDCSTPVDTGSGEVALQKNSVMQGDANYENVCNYLKLIDQRGYERSDHQLRFHDAFLRATSRVIWKADWSRRESEIKQARGWDKTPSEILISTPRRFGKTFRYNNHTSHDSFACSVHLLCVQYRDLCRRHGPLVWPRGCHLQSCTACVQKAARANRRVMHTYARTTASLSSLRFLLSCAAIGTGSSSFSTARSRSWNTIKVILLLNF